ncbi:MAG TPA: type II toxin-antitoxin system PemK/MazF family toxin [Gammaproteobacteria bacterium]|nr:type II toxin-antitoxin system PemK/MazF family toxin [Gammaproteobacteria bacterium]
MSTTYVPDRNDVLWLDFEPQKGKEIGKYRPALVLSSKDYNKKSGLLICSPISTSIRGHITEVPLDALEKPSVVAASLIQTLDWRRRKAKFIAKVDDQIIKEVLYRLLPLIGGDLL